MREIRFRAWDPFKKEMVYSDDFGYHDYNDMMPFWGTARDNEWQDIMQYIGKKDKTGRKIYEKDIVEEGGARGVVEWDESQLKYQYKTCFGTAGFYGFTGKVISNIYETPELMNEKEPTNDTDNRK